MNTAIELNIRNALAQDAGEMARLINEIISIGGTTAYVEPFDEAGIIDDFISPPLGISCFVAIRGSQILGFQALEWCDPDWQGDHVLPSDWAVIATYVDPNTHKQGIGRQLFTRTKSAAKEADVQYIDATIRKENTGGLAYYQGIGFSDYHFSMTSLHKRYAP